MVYYEIHFDKIHGVVCKMLECISCKTMYFSFAETNEFHYLNSYSAM